MHYMKPEIQNESRATAQIMRTRSTRRAFSSVFWSHKFTVGSAHEVHE